MNRRGPIGQLEIGKWTPRAHDPGRRLAPYATRVEDSLGRRYPEPPHPYRNAYVRDRDRIIHARAFRRLENKTQVFSQRYSDHFRNRLTHTLEVAQISRTVARALGLNEDLVEALALAHDVGHPPYGHAGEDTLNRLMKRFGDGFDHNLHALRIVEWVEQRYADFPGLNLTFEVREGIIKHSRDYEPDSYPELQEYILDQRPPLEAQLIDLADEIAYNCADLDDGYESKLLTLSALVENLPLFRKLWLPLRRKHPQAAEKLTFNEALKRMMDLLITDLIETTQARLTCLGVGSPEQVRLSKDRLVSLSAPLSRESRRIKDFLNQRLYSHPRVRRERRKIVRHVADLFELFRRRPRLLPRAYFSKTHSEPVQRVVCDYIAGMTDNFLEQQYGSFLSHLPEARN